MADYLTFANIYGELQRAIKHFKSSQVTLVKEIANMTYFELLNADDLFPIFWLRDLVDTFSLKAPSVISAITKADPGVVTTSAAHGLVAGDLVTLYNIVGMTELNNRIVRCGTVASTTFQLLDLDGSNIDTSSYTTYSSAGDVTHRGITLPSASKVQDILSFTLHGYAGGLKKITEKELEEDTSYWSDSVTKPERYLLRKTFTTAGAEQNLLLWFPGCDAAYDPRIWFEKSVSPLSADADVPIMPPQFHHAIVSGGVTRLIESNVQVENAVIWPSIYKMQKSQLIDFNRKFYKAQDQVDRERPLFL